jgi:phage protein D
MDGKYFVDQMEHSISPSSGYKTQVKASKVEKEDFA